ncbi:MAG: radical SAM protein [Thermodesulfovibrionales bacterium]|jgi:MoaA/NifB/PqqE/SkfB family radical SAM enzyme
MMNFDVIADWTLNKFCNFSCPYCFVSMKDRRDGTYKGNDVQRIINSFNNSEKIWLVHMSGGEPFFHPDFIDLCKGLTEKHCISLNTNLSNQLVYDFCENIDPKKVSFVHCSLHISERENQKLLNDFIEKVRVLEQATFNVFITQVMWPPIVDRFNQIFEFFKKKGMLVRPKLFRGNYRWEEYPQSYSEREKSTILHFMKLIGEADQSGRSMGHINPDLEKLWINGYVSFRNLPCLAGVKSVAIDFNGNIKRCHSDPTNLGNIYRDEFNLLENAQLCKANICGCPYYGFIFASGKHKIVKSRIPLFVQRMFKRI